MAHAHAVALETIRNEAKHIDQHVLVTGNTSNRAAE
jgi:hypothetical protein